MRAGIISDTHNILPGQVFDIFKTVDCIFHAGDIGSTDVIQALEIIAPVYAVYGNVDAWPLTIKFKDLIVQQIADLRICVVHDILKPEYFSYQLFKKNLNVDIVIHGHTHVAGYKWYRNVLYINPGSVAKPRDRNKGTVALLDTDIKPLNPQIIELEKSDT